MRRSHCPAASQVKNDARIRGTGPRNPVRGHRGTLDKQMVLSEDGAKASASGNFPKASSCSAKTRKTLWKSL